MNRLNLRSLRVRLTFWYSWALVLVALLGGTGLGLAIAREIAERHRAKLTVESSVRRGSTFTVRLRRSAEEASTVHTSREAILCQRRKQKY